MWGILPDSDGKPGFIDSDACDHRLDGILNCGGNAGELCIQASHPLGIQRHDNQGYFYETRSTLPLCSHLSPDIPRPAFAQWKYPPTKTVDAADTYFGKTYPDPYRWLEDLKDKDVETWFKEQADLTESTLAKIPGRKALADEWIALDKLKPFFIQRHHR